VILSSGSLFYYGGEEVQLRAKEDMGKIGGKEGLMKKDEEGAVGLKVTKISVTVGI
jgi:hypothetical protein